MKQYTKQDKDAKRKWVNNYVTTKWLKSCFGKNCSCGDVFIYETKNNGNITSNLTADRIDNNESHHIDNIVAKCVLCNTSKSDNA